VHIVSGMTHALRRSDMKTHTTSCDSDPANEYTTGTVRVEEKAILVHVAKDRVIDFVRPWASVDGEVSHGHRDSAPGTMIIMSRLWMPPYGAVVAAPYADSDS
jgi:hypothetical protein